MRGGISSRGFAARNATISVSSTTEAMPDDR
jgi:hypothetical protein